MPAQTMFVNGKEPATIKYDGDIGVLTIKVDGRECSFTREFLLCFHADPNHLFKFSGDDPVSVERVPCNA